MAITRTYIYSSDELTRQQNLAAWLQANAVPDYFDRVEIDETDSDGGYPVTCYVGELAFLKIYIPSTSTYLNIVASTYNGTTRTFACSSSVQTEYGYKCKNGLLIKLEENVAGISIVKDNTGSTCLVAMNKLVASSSEATSTAGSTTNRLYVISPETGTITYLGGVYPHVGFQRTVLAPLVVSDTVNYTPDAYLMTHTQFTGEGTIDIDGVKYLTNGLWCIRDE